MRTVLILLLALIAGPSIAADYDLRATFDAPITGGAPDGYRLYRGHDNKASITVLMDGAPMDFSAVTRMTLALRGHDALIDSDQDAGAIDWSEGGGKIVFALGPFDIKPGTYDATLVAYDPAHPAGQVIAHPSGVQLTFRVIA